MKFRSNRLSAVFPCILFFSLLAAAARSEEETAVDYQTPLDRASISFRLGLNIWEDSDRFNDLLAIFDRYPGVTDELTFFTDPVHTPPPVDLFLRRISIMKERIARAKAHGYRSASIFFAQSVIIRRRCRWGSARSIPGP